MHMLTKPVEDHTPARTSPGPARGTRRSAGRAAHVAPSHRIHGRGSSGKSRARRLVRAGRRWFGRRASARGMMERAHVTPLRAAIVLAALIAIAGGVLAAGMMGIGRGQPPSRTPGDPFTRTEQVTTSFGLLQVESVDASQGLTSAQLSGQNHGIQGLVNPDQMEVQVSLAIKNSITAPVVFTPEMFALISDNGAAAVAPTFSDFESDTLQPQAQVEGTLSFIAPLGAKKLLLRFDDPGQHQAVVIDLGKVTVGVTR
ncbi:MAG TPA: hypothetical protein VLJ14_05210 [Ktedonobacterales bacterium]|nr:hypothetical protein [Ktedonobacterales bacterium]